MCGKNYLYVIVLQLHQLLLNQLIQGVYEIITPFLLEVKNQWKHYCVARAHQGKDDDAFPIRLTGSSQHREGGHVGSEKSHQQDKGPDGATCQEVVLAGAAE